jgi:YHS domain-containing protein
MKMKVLNNDPVCGMQIVSHEYITKYLDSSYSFCSAQCRDRFVANPHLYIGLSGQKAPKQEGLVLLKSRILRLAEPLSKSQSDGLTEALQGMMGIKSVQVNGDEIRISYDLMQTTAEQIKMKIAEIGMQLGEGWPQQLRLAFVNYEENIEVGSLRCIKKVYLWLVKGDPACCRP